MTTIAANFGVSFEELHTLDVGEINSRQIQMLMDQIVKDPMIQRLNEDTDGRFLQMCQQQFGKYMDEFQTDREIGLLREILDTQERFDKYEDLMSCFGSAMARLQSIVSEIIEEMITSLTASELTSHVEVIEAEGAVKH